MPGYSGSGQAAVIGQGLQVHLFDHDTVSVSESSIACLISRLQGSFYPWGVSYEIAFSGAPGTFEIDVQTADTDADAYYVTIASITTGALNAGNVGRIELPNFWARYTRVKVVSFANAATVNLTVLLTR